MPIHHTAKVGNPLPVTQEGPLAVSLVPAGGGEDVTLKLVDSLQNIDNTLKHVLKQLELITGEELDNGTD